MSRINILNKALDWIRTHPSETVTATALMGLSIILVDPTQLIGIATGIGTNALSSTIDRIGQKDSLSDDDIKELIDQLKQGVQFDELLTQKIFLNSFDRLKLMMDEQQLMTASTHDQLRKLVADAATGSKQDEILALVRDVLAKLDDSTPLFNKSSIFLSYGRGDVYPKGTTNVVEREQHFPIVEKVYNNLKSVGDFTPWLDKYDLTTDREFTDSINKAIENSQYMLLFIGQHAMTSDWCKREWMHALRHCVPIIPILLEGDWGDDGIQQTYPTRILHTDGINPQKTDQTIDDQFLFSKIIQAIKNEPAPLTLAFGAKKPPTWYIERPQYTEALKRQLAVNDKDYSGSNIVGITSEQETAALQGVGGIGKTTLAQAICNDCDVRRAFDQIFWLNVGPEVDETGVQSLMLTIGTHFQDDPAYYQTLETARVTVQRHLAGKRNLIVLDDVWVEGIVDEFSFAGVDCRLLVTTRNKSLVDEGEAVSKLSENEGLRLLATILDPINPDPEHLSDDHRAIVDKLDGYTLAIEIAGKWLKKYPSETASDYLNRLESDEAKLFDYLQVSQRDKNANLALSLSLSYSRLSDDEQAYFRQLGVLAPASTVDQDLLRALWDVDDLRFPLQTLLDLGLLDEIDGRYSQHGLIRAYARQALQQQDEESPTFARYADHVIEIAEDFDRLPFEEWKQLDADLPHIDHVGDELTRLWGDETRRDDELTQQAGDFAYRVTRYVLFRPLAMREGDDVTLRGMNWLDTGLAIFRQTKNQKRESLMLNEIAVAWNGLGDRRKALEFYNQALPLRREVGDKSGEATTLNNIGNAWNGLGDRRKALEFYNQALPLRREVGDKSGEATTLNNIGNAWDNLGDRQKALEFYNQALLIQREVGDKAGEATTLNNIGAAWNSLGDRRKALEFYNQALLIQREVGDKSGEATMLNNIGSAWDNLGDRRKALEFYNQALPLRREVGDKSGEATTLSNIAGIQFAEGKLEEAIATAKHIAVVFEQIGAISELAATHYNLAHAYNKIGQVGDAIAQVEQAMALLQSKGLTLDAAGQTIERMQSFLSQLKGEAPPQQDSEYERRLQQITLDFLQHGEDHVRAALKGNPPEVIEQVMSEVKQRAYNESMQALQQLYDSEGADKLREVLTAQGYDEATIAAVIGNLRGDSD